MSKPQRNGYASRVNILKYIKVADKWRFAPAQTSNNKLKMDCVLIDGKPERHPEGTYYIEWYENGRRCRQSVKDSAEVLERLGGNVTMRLYPGVGHSVNWDEIRFIQDMMDALSE